MQILNPFAARPHVSLNSCEDVGHNGGAIRSLSFFLHLRVSLHVMPNRTRRSGNVRSPTHNVDTSMARSHAEQWIVLADATRDFSVMRGILEDFRVSCGTLDNVRQCGTDPRVAGRVVTL